MIERRRFTKEAVAGGSNKTLGIVFCIVFVMRGLFPLLHGNSPRILELEVAFIFLFCALTIPSVLSPLNVVWSKLGSCLHVVMNPIILGVVFFTIITPLAFLLRILGKRPLGLNQCNKDSYWIKRVPPEPQRKSFRLQF